MATLSRVTQGARDDWPFVLFCDHESAADAIGTALGHDQTLSMDEASRLADKIGALLEQAPHSFDDGEVGELSSWATGAGAECTWRCPVCGEEHHETADADDFIDPDADRD